MKNCWILTEYRSGSSYLCYLLNSTNYFQPEFKEYFHLNLNESLFKKIYKKRFQLEIDKKNKNVSEEFFFSLKKEKIKLPNYCKFHREQFVSIFEDSDKEEIKKYIPNLHYVLLEREDIFARTISNYFSFYTKIWGINKKNSDLYFSKKIPFDEKTILKIYERNVNRENWKNFLKNEKYLHIKYENLIENPKKIIEQILIYLDLSYDNLYLDEIIQNCPSLKMKRPETEDYIKYLKDLLKSN